MTILPDTQNFLATIRAERGGWFEAHRPITLARAPLSLDVIGGTAEYGGSLVLGMPLAQAVFVALQLDPEPVVRISYRLDGRGSRTDGFRPDAAPPFEMMLNTLAPEGVPVEYAHAQDLLAAQAGVPRWAACVLGCWPVLMREEFVRLGGGARVLIGSTAPPGVTPGSTALVAATLRALLAIAGVHLDPRECALLCRRVEHLAGVPIYGMIHPATAMAGVAGHITPLLCRPCTFLDKPALPQDLAIWGITPGRYAPSPAAQDARLGALLGYRMLAEAAGLPVKRESGQAHVCVQDQRWRGYLAQLTPSEYAGRYRAVLPTQITGRDFLARYGGVTDPAVQIDPAQTYAVRHPTAHVIMEHFRAHTFAALLRGSGEEQNVAESPHLLGELMYQSHESWARCVPPTRAGSDLVALVREAGPGQGLYGARVSDNGIVVVLGHVEAAQAVQNIAGRYAGTGTTRENITVLGGSSDGVLVTEEPWQHDGSGDEETDEEKAQASRVEGEQAPTAHT